MTKEINKNRPDALGDRMKSYEAIGTKTTLIPNLPVYCRIDGRAFHSFCRGFNKPFDLDFIQVMNATCSDLVRETGAILGYVQSDEISLAWEDFTKAPFDGKLFKLQSILSSLATSFFWKNIVPVVQDGDGRLFDKCFDKPVSFDCRVFQVPNMVELANCFIWRENDATRNSVQMLAQANFSHKQLQGKKVDDLQNMLLTEKNINWNNLDVRLKRGGYFQKRNIVRTMTDEEYFSIPEKQRPETREIVRSVVVELADLPIMRTVENKVEAYFYSEKPVLKQ